MFFVTDGNVVPSLSNFSEDASTKRNNKVMDLHTNHGHLKAILARYINFLELPKIYLNPQVK